MKHIKNFNESYEDGKYLPDTTNFISELRKEINIWKSENKKRDIDFAKLANIGTAYFSEIFLGNKMPTLNTILKMCNALNKTIVITNKSDELKQPKYNYIIK